ncbi:MAG: hypothetical protein ACI4SF_11195 [Oscillospiraceae bacterium]
MSIKSVIACCKYQLYKMRFIPLFFAIYVFGSMFISAIIISVIEKTTFNLSGCGSILIDLIMGFVIFGFMCSFMSDYLNTAAANGVSRTTACVSAFISSVIFSVASAIEVSILYPIVSLISGDNETWGANFYGSINSLQEAGWSMFAIRLRFLGICLFAFIALSAVAIFLASIAYKLPKWAAAIIICAMAFIPTLGVYFTLGTKALAVLWTVILAILGVVTENPLQGAAVCIGLSLVLLLLSCLITKRSSAKPLAIKSD